MSKDTDERSTPQDLFDLANQLCGPFTLDACATHENAKCSYYFTKEDDGLKAPWSGRVWCNCPYSRGQQILWVKRAGAAVDTGEAELVCMLLPSDTSTKLFHDYLWDGTWRPGVEGIFLRGRGKFNGVSTPAKFGSLLVVLRRPE